MFYMLTAFKTAGEEVTPDDWAVCCGEDKAEIDGVMSRCSIRYTVCGCGFL